MAELIWKKGKQKLAIIIEVNKKVYQVALNKENMDTIISFLPQLFGNGIIKILPEELPIKLTNFKK